MARGRKTKLTPELLKQIRKYIMAGNYFETACFAVGITPKTGYNWLNQGEELWKLIEEGKIGQPSRQKHFQEYLFAIEIRKAEASAEMADIAYIKAGLPNWQSRSWLRERRSRDRWGKSEKHEITGKDGDAIKSEAVIKVVSEKSKKLVEALINGEGT